MSNASKVQTALKLSQVQWATADPLVLLAHSLRTFSQEDQNTIGSLKREIEKAWKMVDASHEKEARAKG